MKLRAFGTKTNVALAAMLVLVASLIFWKGQRIQSRGETPANSAKAFDLQSEAKRLGLSVTPDGILRQLSGSAPRDCELRSSHGWEATFAGVRLVQSSTGPRVAVQRARFRITGSLTEVLDEWRSLNNIHSRVTIENADLEFEDRFLSRVLVAGISLASIESGFRVSARTLQIGPKRWDAPAFTVEKPKSVALIHWAGTEPDSRPLELRYVRTPGVATEWILEVPSQPTRSSAILGIKTLPCARATGTLSIIVPDNPKVAMRGRFQSVADDCQGPKWSESNALFGGTVAVAFSVQPDDEHHTWNLSSAEFTSAMFELRGKGTLTLEGEPELSWEAVGSRTCAQLEAHLAPSRYLDQVKSFMNQARLGAGARAAGKATVTLSMQGKVRGTSLLERTISWRLSGNCGISDEVDTK